MKKHYCGPVALSILTGKDITIITGKVLGLRGYSSNKAVVTGMWWREMKEVLQDTGIKIEELTVPKPRVTLARWLKIQKRDPRPYLIFASHHFLVVKGRKIFDNQFIDGVWLRKYTHRRMGVKNVCVCG
jgi:hypothetical protein